MSISHNSILISLWPDFESKGYQSMELSLSNDDRTKLLNVMSERKMTCHSCGRGDNENYWVSVSFIGKSLKSIHIFCRCGYRIGSISRASLNPAKKPRKITQITFDQILELAEPREVRINQMRNY